MAMKTGYRVKVEGHDAIAILTSYKHVKGSFSFNAPSDLDYYGYTEIEFELKDKNKQPEEGDCMWLFEIANNLGLWEDIEKQILKQIEEDTQWN